MLYLKRSPQSLHGRLGGFRGMQSGFSLGFLHLFCLSSGVFEGCFLADFSSPVGSFEKKNGL